VVAVRGRRRRCGGKGSGVQNFSFGKRKALSKEKVESPLPCTGTVERMVGGVENPVVQKTIVFLEKAGKKNKARIWKRVAEMIKGRRRGRREVNLSGLAKFSGTIVVPGKVLGRGEGKAVQVAALAFSATAREKIEKAGGKAMAIPELVESNPKGSNVKIIG